MPQPPIHPSVDQDNLPTIEELQAMEDDGPSLEELTAQSLGELLPPVPDGSSQPENTSPDQPIPDWFRKAYESI